MAGDEKKIEKILKHISLNLKNLEENMNELEKESNEKKRKKIQDEIASRKRLVTKDGEKLGELNVSLDEYRDSLNETQKKLLDEIFPHGADENSIGNQRERVYIIQKYKKWIEKLVELEEKYPPYDKELPVKEKLKSKIYKQEKNIGYYMLVDSEEGSSAYEESWNYTRDFATTTEFTPEEREIIQRCIIVGHEYDEYTSEKYAFINNIRNSIYEQKHLQLERATKDAVNDLVTELFPTVIKECYEVSDWTEEEINREARRMAREYLQVVSDEEARAQLLVDRDRVQKEQYDTLKKDMGIVGKVMLRGENSENVMMLYMINELGADRGIYAMLYGAYIDSGNNPEAFKTILKEYSFEDLGIAD